MFGVANVAKLEIRWKDSSFTVLFIEIWLFGIHIFYCCCFLSDQQSVYCVRILGWVAYWVRIALKLQHKLNKKFCFALICNRITWLRDRLLRRKFRQVRCCPTSSANVGEETRFESLFWSELFSSIVFFAGIVRISAPLSGSTLSTVSSWRCCNAVSQQFAQLSLSASNKYFLPLELFSILKCPFYITKFN